MSFEYGMTILEGNPAKFSCRVANLETSQWQVRRPDGTLQAFAQGDRVYSPQKEKFQLEIRNESSGSNTSYFQTLTLKDATVDDDGQYRCEEEGEIRNLTSLTVESTPVLHLKINNNTVITTNSDVVLNQEVTIECIAEGGKPPVNLSWRVNGEEKNLLIDNPPSIHERVTSTIHLFPTKEDKTLTCVASGQKVTQHTDVSVGLNVQFKPDCVMEIVNCRNEYVGICSCNANPEVKKYEIDVNGSLFSNERKANLPSENPATVFCNATNDVGSFATKPQNLDPLHGNDSTQGSGSWWIVLVVVISVSAVLMLLFVCLHKWKKKKDSEEASTGKIHSEPGPSGGDPPSKNDDRKIKTEPSGGDPAPKKDDRDAAQCLQAATPPQASKQVQMVTLNADQGDSTMGPDNEGEGKVKNGTTKLGETEQTEVTVF